MNEPRGWVFYDGQCPICRGGAERFHRLLHSRGYGLAPLQTPWVQKRLGLDPGFIPDEMRVLTHDNRILGGADGVIYLAGEIWWAWPLSLIARLPLMNSLSWALYRWIARNRYCLGGSCSLHAHKEPSSGTWEAWIGLILIAVVGSGIFGGSLALLFPDWRWDQGALWLILSAGLSWCVFVPLLALFTHQRFIPLLYKCLVTMAFGEAVLVSAAVLNVIFWKTGAGIPAAGFNYSAVGVSNIVMVTVLGMQLRTAGVSFKKTLVLWIVFLNGTGAVLFWLFRRLLLGETL